MQLEKASIKITILRQQRNVLIRNVRSCFDWVFGLRASARTLEDCAKIIEGIVKVVKDINPDALVICHGGPISEPKDAAYIIENVPGIDGFFGATSIERLAAERGIKAQTEAFKSIKK